MSMRKLAPPTGMVGLCVGGRWISAVDVTGASRATRCVRRAVHVRRWTPGVPGADAKSPPITPEEASELCGILARQGIVQRGLHAVLEGNACPSTLLELPPRSSGAPLDQIARAEVARSQRQDDHAFELAMWDTPAIGRQAGAERSTALAASCPHAVGESLAGAFDDTGMFVESLDTTMRALVRACRPLLVPRPRGTPAAIAHVGWDGAEVGVVGEMEGRDVLVYQRALPDLGLRALYEDLRTKRSLTHEAVDALLLAMERDAAYQGRMLTPEVAAHIAHFVEMLAPEVERSIAYAGRRSQEQGQRPLVLLTGEGATLRGLSERLRGSFHVEARVVRAGDVALIPDTLAGFRASTAILAALGAAIRTPVEEGTP